MKEKMSGPRMMLLKASTISFGGRHRLQGSKYECLRAFLEVESSLGIPLRFTPVIRADQVRQSCRLIWSSEDRIEILLDRTDDGTPVRTKKGESHETMVGNPSGGVFADVPAGKRAVVGARQHGHRKTVGIRAHRRAPSRY